MPPAWRAWDKSPPHPRICWASLWAAWDRNCASLRLVSLRLSNVYDERPRSALAFDVPFEICFAGTQFNPAIAILKQDARERLADAVDKLREKFGRQVVLHEHDFILRFHDGRGH